MKTDIDQMIRKIEELKKSGTYDLSMEEDLSLAVMNLIALEEHFFFTAEKTHKTDYLDLVNQTREIRKQLLAKLMPENEGETWCISKHLLSATMRMMEVATKLQSTGKKDEAKKMFDDAYKVYSMFWAIRLKLIDLKGVKQKEGPALRSPAQRDEVGWSYEDLVTKLIDCCKE